MRRLSLTLLGLLACVLAIAPSGAAAAPSKGSKAQPKITRVLPMRVRVGDTLTIKGSGFRARPRRNTVIFRSGSGRTAFAKPRRASRRKLVLRVPASVARLLRVADGRQRPTRLNLRVLAGTFSKFTPRRLSPVVVSATDTSGPGGKPGKPIVVCNDDSDHDNDLLSNSLELQVRTDPCLLDTDKDGTSDGWEYFSAKDLNTKAVPYPGKRPYPNPLDPSDADADFDGDVLPAGIEFRLWRYSGSSFQPARTGTTPGSPLGYSDGTQASRPEETPSAPAFRSPQYTLPYAFSPPAYPARYVMPHAGAYHAANWTDDERDADADGLNNYVETAGPGLASWWTASLAKEEVDPWPETYFGSFTKRPFADTDPADPDLDGDTLLDGEDDQDDDDVLNFHEMYDPGDLYGLDSRRKNAFNPCAPDGESRTCPLYEPL